MRAVRHRDLFTFATAHAHAETGSNIGIQNGQEKTYELRYAASRFVRRSEWLWLVVAASVIGRRLAYWPAVGLPAAASCKSTRPLENWRNFPLDPSTELHVRCSRAEYQGPKSRFLDVLIGAAAAQYPSLASVFAVSCRASTASDRPAAVAGNVTGQAAQSLRSY